MKFNVKSDPYYPQLTDLEILAEGAEEVKACLRLLESAQEPKPEAPSVMSLDDVCQLLTHVSSAKAGPEWNRPHYEEDAAKIIAKACKKSGRKILGIKMLKTAFGLGIKEAKDLVERYYY